MTGVETTLFMQDDLQYDGLTELIVTEPSPSARPRWIRRGDAFIAFPGGTGTLEEIAEVMSKVSLKQLDAPCILYNLNGYYNGLKTLLGSYDRNRAFDKRAAGRNLVCGEPGADQADSESIKTPKYHRTPHST